MSALAASITFPHHMDHLTAIARYRACDDFTSGGVAARIAATFDDHLDHVSLWPVYCSCAITEPVPGSWPCLPGYLQLRGVVACRRPESRELGQLIDEVFPVSKPYATCVLSVEKAPDAALPVIQEAWRPVTIMPKATALPPLPAGCL